MAKCVSAPSLIYYIKRKITLKSLGILCVPVPPVSFGIRTGIGTMCVESRAVLSRSVSLLQIKLASPQTKVMHHHAETGERYHSPSWLDRKLKIENCLTDRVCHINFVFSVCELAILQNDTFLRAQWPIISFALRESWLRF